MHPPRGYSKTKLTYVKLLATSRRNLRVVSIWQLVPRLWFQAKGAGHVHLRLSRLDHCWAAAGFNLSVKNPCVGALTKHVTGNEMDSSRLHPFLSHRQTPCSWLAKNPAPLVFNQVLTWRNHANVKRLELNKTRIPKDGWLSFRDTSWSRSLQDRDAEV